MFHSDKKPFYQSATTLLLEPIESDIYYAFAQKQFSQSGKQLQKEAFDYVYDLFEGITSASFIKHHNLKSASAVQSASKALQESGMLMKKGNTYSLSDPMTRIWLEQRH